MTKNKIIGFRLASIRTNEFATVEDVNAGEDKISIKTGVGVRMSIEKCVIFVDTKFTFIYDNCPFIILNSECIFIVDDNHFKSFKNDSDDSYVIPKDFITHLAVIAVGTARGILHSKTENTEYNKYLLPTINLTKIIKEDLVVKN